MTSNKTIAMAVEKYITQEFPVTLDDIAWYPDDQKCESCIGYPDYSNQFPDTESAITFLLEEGISIWCLNTSQDLVIDVFTYDKFNTIFGAV